MTVEVAHERGHPVRHPGPVAGPARGLAVLPTLARDGQPAVQGRFHRAGPRQRLLQPQPEGRDGGRAPGRGVDGVPQRPVRARSVRRSDRVLPHRRNAGSGGGRRARRAHPGRVPGVVHHAERRRPGHQGHVHHRGAGVLDHAPRVRTGRAGAGARPLPPAAGEPGHHRRPADRLRRRLRPAQPLEHPRRHRPLHRERPGQHPGGGHRPGVGRSRRSSGRRQLRDRRPGRARRPTPAWSSTSGDWPDGACR